MVKSAAEVTRFRSSVDAYAAADFNEQRPGANPERRFDHDFGPKFSSKSVTQTAGGCSYL